jgi:hypothetical protein
MRAEMARLQAEAPVRRRGPRIGLFGMMELRKNAKATPLAPYNGSHPAMNQLAKFFRAEGLFTFVRGGATFMCNPPLCITRSAAFGGLRDHRPRPTRSPTPPAMMSPKKITVTQVWCSGSKPPTA